MFRPLFKSFGVLFLSVCFVLSCTPLKNKLDLDLDDPPLETGSLNPTGDISLPIAYLDAGLMFAGTPDSEGFIPVVIFENGLSFDENQKPIDKDGDGYLDDVFLEVSDEPSTTSLNSKFFKSALAQTQATRCPILVSGASECFFKTQTLSPKDLFLSVVNETNTLLTHTEPVKAGLHYLSTLPRDVLFAKDQIFLLADSGGVEIKKADDSSALKLKGDYTKGYPSFETKAQKLIYNELRDEFFALSSLSGIEQFIYGADSLTPQDKFVIAEALQYKALSSFKDTVYYGIESTVAQLGILYNLFEGTSHYSEIDDTLYNHIVIVDSSVDLDDAALPMTHKNTHAFDINELGLAVVAFEDALGQIRLRAANATKRFGGETLLFNPQLGALFINAVLFYDDSKLLLMDQTHSVVWPIVVDEIKKELPHRLTQKVKLPLSPVAWGLHPDETYLYVIGSENEDLKIYSLKQSDGSTRFLPVLAGEFLLKDFMPDKKFEWDPLSLTVSDETLFVSSQNTQSLLEISLSSLVLESLPDEDFDKDGQTPAEGDCIDNDETIFLKQTEVCGDNQDNNCNGTIDENCDFDGDGQSTNKGDCNDLNSAIYSGATEICDDAIDNNCNGVIEENCEGVEYL